MTPRAAVAMLLVAAAVPCHAAAAPVRVVATTTDLGALVEAVGGDRVAVTTLLGGAQNPHAFQARPAHLAALRDADLLVRIGADHDDWVVPLAARAGNTRLAPRAPGHVTTAKGVELLDPAPRTGGAAGHVHAFGNTHYWLDPANVAVMTQTIAGALAAAAPDARAGFEARRAALLARLDAAVTRWTAALAPFRGARVVAVHDSFPYLARRFGVQVVGHIEPQPGIAPPPAHVARVVREMRAHGVRVVLAEAWQPDQVARRVADAAGATVIRLPTSVGGVPGTDDYVALLDEIVRRLVEGFRAAGLGGP